MELVADRTNFGVVGDGVTDDTDALQRAIDTLRPTRGGDVILPDNDYLITRPLRVENSKARQQRQVRLVGRSSWSIGTDTNSGPSLVWAGNDTDPAIRLYSRDCQIEGVQIRAKSGYVLNAAVHMAAPDDPDGIVTTNHFNRLFVNGQQGEVRYGVLAGRGGSAGNNEDHDFTRCQFLQCSVAGVHVDDVGGQAKWWMFDGCHFRHGRPDLATHIVHVDGNDLLVPDLDRAIGVWFKSGSFQMHGRCNLAQLNMGIRIDDKCYEPVLLQSLDSEGCVQFAKVVGNFSMTHSRVACNLIPPGGTLISGGRHLTFDNCEFSQHPTADFTIRPEDGAYIAARQTYFGSQQFVQDTYEGLPRNGNAPQWMLSPDGVRSPKLMPDGTTSEKWHYGLRKRGYARDWVYARFDNGIVNGNDSEPL